MTTLTEKKIDDITLDILDKKMAEEYKSRRFT